MVLFYNIASIFKTKKMTAAAWGSGENFQHLK